MHVSDLHIGNRQQLEFAARSLRAELAQSPDLICMTGDFINRKLFNPRECSQLFAALAAKAPVVACLGNHDGGRWVRRRGGYPDALPVTELLSKSGVTVLRNENRVVEIRGQPLTLVGLDDKWSGSLDAERGFQGLLAAPPGPRIVLAHNPDMKGVLKNYAWDLMLSGHTHGGQVCLPFLGAPVLPVEDRRFTHGLYPWDGRQIHVSSGVGTSCGVRFNCPPEICHLELKGSVS